jgi:hypothetical protein
MEKHGLTKKVDINFLCVLAGSSERDAEAEIFVDQRVLVDR